VRYRWNFKRTGFSWNAEDRGSLFGNAPYSDYSGSNRFVKLENPEEDGKMTRDILQQLQALDTEIITEVVRKDQRDPELRLTDWVLEPLSHEKIIDTTGGLFRFSGHCSGPRGKQAWTVVLKCINNPLEWSQHPGEWSYWKRELLAYQTGLLDHLPPGLRAPRCYGVVEKDSGAWAWIEYIKECTDRRWSLENFLRAAHRLGQFQGAYLNGTPLPQQPWLCRPFFRSIWAEDDWWFPYMNPESENNAWKSPLIKRAFKEDCQPRVLELLSKRALFLNANDRLPQVLCHNDAHRRNFMWAISPDTGQEELIAVDWAFFGPGAVGNDLGELAGNSLYFLDYPVRDAASLLESILDPYLVGIAENGVKIDSRLVKLGYLIGLTFWMGLQLPGWAALMLAPESDTNIQAMYGAGPEQVLASWARLDSFLLDRADEAMILMRELGL
jgi:hypothetical protein